MADPRDILFEPPLPVGQNKSVQAAVRAALKAVVEPALRPGQAAQGRYRVEPTVPGLWSEEDEFRQQSAQGRQAIDTTELAASLFGLRGAKKGELDIFGGRGAKTANLDMLAKAQTMAAAGLPAKRIRDATGWFQGPEKQWKHEIHDDLAKLGDEGVRHAPGGRLKEHLIHPELYKAYPELRNMRVQMHGPGQLGRGVRGGYDPDAKQLHYVGGMSEGDTLDVILHEVMHNIQQREKFATGTNTAASIDPGLPGFDLYQAAKDNLRKQKVRLTPQRLDELRADIGKEAYRRSAGEAEARNVMYRRDYSPEQRNASAPWETQDVPFDQQLVHFNQDQQGMQALADPPLFTSANRGSAPVESVGRTAPAGGGVLPGIYASPKRLAEEAEAMVAPEHPAMKAIFGVNRGDLYDISLSGTRAGNVEPNYRPGAAPRGVNYVAGGIMNPYNEARLQDQLSYGLAHAPNLRTGMVPWYVMDPAFQFLEKRIGREAAEQAYKQFNTVVPMFSPGSPVPVEINRGTRANMMINQGKWDQFARYGGIAEKNRAGMPDFPPELMGMLSHPYHKTSQVIPVEKYLKSGRIVSDNPKVPLYSQATGVPEIGFQAERFIPDTHVAGSLGAPDIRKTAGRTGFLDDAEYNALGPWYEQKIAHPLGIRSVPMQGFQWGLYAPATGVKTGIGQPKLELLAQSVMERAQREGLDPIKLMLDVLTGKSHANWLLPGAAGGAVAAGAMTEPELPR